MKGAERDGWIFRMHSLLEQPTHHIGEPRFRFSRRKRPRVESELKLIEQDGQFS
jgi:hypothetical protein